MYAHLLDGHYKKLLVQNVPKQQQATQPNHPLRTGVGKQAYLAFTCP